MRQIHTTYLHTVRQELEDLNTYHLLLQEQGKLTDEIYFGTSETTACQISIPNEYHKFIGFPESAI